MKKYMSINRLKERHFDSFEKGDIICVQEKIDGANFSIKYDSEAGIIRAFSRNHELHHANALRGAYGWSQKLDVEKVKEVLGENLILFGEWLVPHTIQYPKEAYNTAYFYDVFDTTTETYLTQDEVEEIIKRLNLTYVPVFYKGEFKSWDDLNKYVDMTELGGECGEGIVVKNMTKLNNPDIKLVV